MMSLYNVLDYTNIVIASIKAATDFHAWDLARQNFGHYYNIYIAKVK